MKRNKTTPKERKLHYKLTLLKSGQQCPIYRIREASGWRDEATRRSSTRGPTIMPQIRKDPCESAALVVVCAALKRVDCGRVRVLVQPISVLLSAPRFGRYNFQSQWLYVGSKNHQIK